MGVMICLNQKSFRNCVVVFLLLGVLSVIYILTFVVVKAGMWGFHMNFSSVDPVVGVPGISSLACD